MAGEAQLDNILQALSSRGAPPAMVDAARRLYPRVAELRFACDLTDDERVRDAYRAMSVELVAAMGTVAEMMTNLAPGVVEEMTSAGAAYYDTFFEDS